MTKNWRQLFGIVVSALFVPVAAAGQSTIRPTERPIVTAENESWYRAGEPLLVDGNVYYPAGAQVFFNPNEMVRTGHYRGVPVYSRTTLEPYSIVFVPVAGGLLQPYERRRSGDVAGTVGSTAPSFPVDRPTEEGGTSVYQAAAPPTSATGLGGFAGPVEETVERPQPSLTEVATSGVHIPSGPLRTAQKPKGLNGFFIEYEGRRWFSRGPAVEFDAALFARVGEYRGFAVYSATDRTDRAIYVAVTDNAQGLLAPYALRE